MKKLLAIILGVAVLFGSFGSAASAAYMPEKDQEIEVELTPEISKYLNPFTGQLSFAIQERIIAEYEAKTGTEFDHYYIWITINGVRVLAIDPPVAMY